MKFLNSDGIVIKKNDYNEADRLLNIFTERYGLVVLPVKGIRKSKRRDRNGAELISMSKFTMYKKSDMLVLSSLELQNPFLGIKGDSFKTRISIYMLSILNNVLVEHEKREKLYRLVLNCFEYIEKEESEQELTLLMAYFLFRLIKEEGIEFRIGEGDYFSIDSSKISGETIEKVHINSRQQKFLENLGRGRIEELRELGFEKQEIEDVVLLLQGYLNYHLNIHINYKRIVREGF